MKVLFIGGTGNISSAVSRLAVERGIDLYHLNRGRQSEIPAGISQLTGDIHQKESVAKLLEEHIWDAVVNWIAYSPSDVENDLSLFRGKTAQYIFISSASAYQKPLSYPIVTESTPLHNPWWEYSRNKIACEERLLRAYREEAFPVTIVRPSYTYDTVIPVAMGGFKEFNIIDRIRKGKKIIVHGDGTSLWTLTHADDFASGFLGLLGHQQTTGQAFHITSDEILTWDQIYQAVGEAAGRKPDIIHIPSDFICSVTDRWTGDLLGDKAHSVIFDNTKIKTLVPEYKAVIPFCKGIKRTLSWFDEKKERQCLNPETESLYEKVLAAYERRL